MCYHSSDFYHSRKCLDTSTWALGAVEGPSFSVKGTCAGSGVAAAFAGAGGGASSCKEVCVEASKGLGVTR